MTITSECLEYIAHMSDGCLRLAISDLDKVIDYCGGEDVEINNVLECLGSYSYSMFFQLVNAIIDGMEDVVLKNIGDVHSQGSDLRLFVEQFLNFCLDVSKYAIFGNCSLTKIPSSMESELKNAVAIENVKSYYMYLVDKLLDLKVTLKNDTNIRDTIEVYFLRMCRYM